MFSPLSTKHTGRALVRASRYFSVTAEQRIQTVLECEFSPSKLRVTDTSGGCGSMFNIAIESSKFKGKNLVQQHKMVTSALAEEIKEMHGLTLNTSVTK